MVGLASLARGFKRFVSSLSFDLEGRTAIVTGAGGGIGRAIAVGLAEAGARVVAVGRRLEALEATCQALGGEALAIRVDVTDAQSISNAVDRAGSVDILVNCAASQLRKPALEIELGEWRALLDVNLTGVFLCSQEVGRRMANADGGVIVNITSLTEKIGLPRLAAYGASKGGVAQLTRALAVEWAPLGIRVNAVAPGRVATAMTADVFAEEDVRDSFLSRIPMGRAGTPADVASAAVFLASDAAAYITGQTIVVDGGWLAGGGAPLG